MITEIKVPDLPESVRDATIAAWGLKVGEKINEEDNLLELETDKVILDVPSPVSGILTKITAKEGVTVMEGDVIGLIDQYDASQDKPIEVEGDSSPIMVNTANASPSVRKAMTENNINGDQLNGSGKNGRILKDDVNGYVENVQNTPTETVFNSDSINHQTTDESNYFEGVSRLPPLNPTSTSTQSSALNQPQTVENSDIGFNDVVTKNTEITENGERPERRVPMTRLRSRIAERLLEVQHNSAILTTFNEVDLSEVSRLRDKYQERFHNAHGIKLGFMSFFIKAATEALKRYPEVNARIENGDIIYQGYYDIGVAVASERGLVVPILRNTDAMGNAEVEKVIGDFGKRARAGQLELEELTGGTFSITNGGIFGSMLSTPILNPPQSAILGMHKIEERPVAVNGEITIRPMMYLALSYDHRIIDGQAAVSFLVKVKELLEDPASLFLEL